MTLDDLLKNLFPGGASQQGGTTPNDLILASLGGGAPSPAPQMSVAREAMAPPQMTAPAGRPATAPQPPAAPAVQGIPEPGFMDRLAAFSSGYRGGGLIGAIANASVGPDREAAAQAKSQQYQNTTMRVLTEQGFSPDEAAMLVGNPKLMNDVLGQKYKQPQRQLKEIFDETTGRKQAALVNMQDGTYTPVGGPAASSGDPTAPSNVREWQHFNSLSPEQQQRYLTMKRADKYLDRGDSYVMPNQVDPSGAPVTVVDKNLANAEAQKVTGKARAEAQIDLPKIESLERSIIKQVDAVLNDPNLPNVTGFQANFPTFAGSSHDVEAKIEQLGNKAFLQAFQDLKGAGQITEMEGMKAATALARLTNLRQSDQGFRESLQDFKNEISRLVQLARQRAGGGTIPQEAIKELMANPGTSGQFDEVFGEGASARYLGGSR